MDSTKRPDGAYSLSTAMGDAIASDDLTTARPARRDMIDVIYSRIVEHVGGPERDHLLDPIGKAVDRAAVELRATIERVVRQSCRDHASEPRGLSDRIVADLRKAGIL